MSERIGDLLVVSASEDVARTIRRVPGPNQRRSIQWVSAANAAIGWLSSPNHGITLVVADKELSDGTPYEVFRFVRRDPDCPYPGMALALTGATLTDADLRRASAAGCNKLMSRPFDLGHLAAALTSWPLDRTDFILGGAYVGPERRVAAAQGRKDERRSSLIQEQGIASTAADYEIKAETTVFRFKRLPAGDTSGVDAVAIRNGLLRATLLPALEHLAGKKQEALGALGQTAESLDRSYTALAAQSDPASLREINRDARRGTALSQQRGLLLIGAILRSLGRWSDGSVRIGSDLVTLVRAHLDGFGSALDRRIVDDGGGDGREIMASLKLAEANWERRTGERRESTSDKSS